MFRIRLLGPRPSYTVTSSCTLGELVIGGAHLRFQLDLAYWSAADYELQWHCGLMRLVRGATSSALMVAYRGTGEDAVHLMWALWREGDKAYVQPHAVLASEVEGGCFDAMSPDGHVGARIPVTEESLPLMEWCVEIEQLFAAALRIRWPYSQ
jgi:hypothetical protein